MFCFFFQFSKKFRKTQEEECDVRRDPVTGLVATIVMDTPGDSNSRFEKSLGLLTTRFVTLLQEAEEGILDLKQVLHQIIFDK